VPHGTFGIPPKRRARRNKTEPRVSYTSPLLRGSELAGSPGPLASLANLCVPIPAGRPHPYPSLDAQPYDPHHPETIPAARPRNPPSFPSPFRNHLLGSSSRWQTRAPAPRPFPPLFSRSRRNRAPPPAEAKRSERSGTAARSDRPLGSGDRGNAAWIELLLLITVSRHAGIRPIDALAGCFSRLVPARLGC
jgi:hypothetical protein